MSTPFERVLVPVDGSRRALQVLAPLRRVLAGAAARPAVTLLRVIGPGEAAADALAAEGALQSDVEEARAILGAKVDVRGEVVRGLPADEIVRHARDAKQDLVAMGYHGRKRLGRWLLGSTAEEVLRASETPVLLWRAGA